MIRSLTLTLAVTALATLAIAEPRPRDFRPISSAALPAQPVAKPIAKPVDGWVGEPAVASNAQEAIASTNKGWEFFDRQQWKESREQFLDALSANPHDHEAAEGLIMSVYHGDSPGVAYELGQKLSPKMPWLPEMVSEAVAGRAEQLISRGDFAAARALVAEIPASDRNLNEVREMLQAEPKPAATGETKTGNALPSAVEFIKQKEKQEKIEKPEPKAEQSRPGKIPTGASKERDLYASALAAFRESRFRTSLWYLDRMPDPGPDLRLLKGYNLLETDRFDEAVVVFEGLYRLDTNDPEIAAGLWRCLFHLDALDYAAELRTELGGMLASLPETAFQSDEGVLDNSCGYRSLVEPEMGHSQFTFAHLAEGLDY